MKILVDARMMGAETSRGIGRVIRELLVRLLRDSSVEWVVVVRRQEQLAGLEGDFRSVVWDIPWYGFKEQLLLPWILLSERPDLAFFPHWNVPILSWTPFVCFVHDLILFHHPNSTKISTRNPWYAKFKQCVQWVLVWYIAKRAKKILVPTQVVADDVQRFFPTSTKRVSVVGEGISLLPNPTSTRPWLSQYVLTVGGAYPHKRLDLVLEAWKTQMQSFPDQVLVMLGEKDLFRERLMEQATRMGLKRIIFPGKVTDDQLANWFTHAEMLIFPSEDEGFGLPPLEALSFGCPVLSSDIACMREVLPKEGVVFFRNGDLNDMIASWNRLLGSLSRYREEAQRGFANAQLRHDWNRTAALVRQAFSL